MALTISEQAELMLAPHIAIYITEMFSLTDSNNIYTSEIELCDYDKAYNAKLDYNVIGFLQRGKGLTVWDGWRRQPREKGPRDDRVR